VKCEKLVICGGAGVPKKKSLLFRARLLGYKCLKVLGRLPAFKPLYEKQRQKRASADYKNASPVMRRTLVNLINSDMRKKLSRIDAETLLIWGERDTDTPLYMGRAMEKLIKGSGLAVINNAGHYSFLDNWPQFSAVLDAFL
jgi:pimeloyl-ACP methyl ester carboxylesterase